MSNFSALWPEKVALLFLSSCLQRIFSLFLNITSLSYFNYYWDLSSSAFTLSSVAVGLFIMLYLIGIFCTLDLSEFFLHCFYLWCRTTFLCIVFLILFIFYSVSIFIYIYICCITLILFTIDLVLGGSSSPQWCLKMMPVSLLRSESTPGSGRGGGAFLVMRIKLGLATCKIRTLFPELSFQPPNWHLKLFNRLSIHNIKKWCMRMCVFLFHSVILFIKILEHFIGSLFPVGDAMYGL